MNLAFIITMRIRGGEGDFLCVAKKATPKASNKAHVLIFSDVQMIAFSYHCSIIFVNLFSCKYLLNIQEVFVE